MQNQGLFDLFKWRLSQLSQDKGGIHAQQVSDVSQG